MKFAIAFSCFGPDVTQTDVLFTFSFAAYWWKRGIHLRAVRTFSNLPTTKRT